MQFHIHETGWEIFALKDLLLKLLDLLMRRKEIQLVHLYHIPACFQVRPKGKCFHFSQHIKQGYSFVVIFPKVDFVKWSFLNFKEWIMVEIFLKVYLK